MALAIGEGQYDEAIDELRLRVAGPQQDPQDLLRLAGLTYAQTRSADRAFAYLDQAAAQGAAASDVARTRVAILKAEARLDDAQRVLDELVAAQPEPAAYLLRASYYTSIARPDLAEQDYVALAQQTPDASGIALLGEFYAQTQRLDQAIAVWLEGLERYPDATQLKRGLAKALLKRGQAGDRESAGRFAAELRAQLPDDTDVLWIQAVYAAGADTPAGLAEARELVRAAVRTAPASPETYLGLADLAWRLAEFATARELAERGLQAAPDDVGLGIMRARAAFALGALDTARDAARTVLRRDARNPDALAVLVEVGNRRGDTTVLQAALGIAQPLLREDPASEIWPLLVARTQAALGQPDAALATMQAFAGTDAGRQSVRTQLVLHELYRQRGEAAGAQRALEAAAALAPDQPDVIHARLVAAAAAQRFDEVVTLATAHASTARPQPELFLSAAALLGASPAHVDAARDLCQRAAELAPGDVRPHLALGDLAYAHGDIDRAVEAYQGVLRMQPAQPEALNNLAWILAERRADYEAALAYARQAVAARPDDANFRDTLGFILRHLPGKLDEAREEFRRSVELAPADSGLRARSLLHLAQVCGALDDRAALAQHLQEALAIEGRTPVFTPAERAEIERLLQAAQGTERVSVAEPH